MCEYSLHKHRICKSDILVLYIHVLFLQTKDNIVHLNHRISDLEIFLKAPFFVWMGESKTTD